MDNNEVIAEADVPPHPETILHEMIEAIEVRVSKQLARHIPERQSAPRSNGGRKTPHHHVEERQTLWVLNALGEQREQHIVLYAVEESPNITLEHPYVPTIVRAGLS